MIQFRFQKSLKVSEDFEKKNSKSNYTFGNKHICTYNHFMDFFFCHVIFLRHFVDLISYFFRDTIKS